MHRWQGTKKVPVHRSSLRCPQGYAGQEAASQSVVAPGHNPQLVLRTLDFKKVEKTPNIVTQYTPKILHREIQVNDLEKLNELLRSLILSSY